MKPRLVYMPVASLEVMSAYIYAKIAISDNWYQSDGPAACADSFNRAVRAGIVFE